MTNLKSKFYKIVLVLYTLISIGSTCYLLFKPAEQDLRLKETEKELQQIKKHLHQRDSGYQQTIDSLTKKSDSLQTVIQQTSRKLDVSKAKTKVLSSQLTRYIDQYKQDTNLTKDPAAFDSLSHLSIDYQNEATIRDSLCDQETASLRELVAVKDAQIKADSLILSDYKQSVDQLTATNEDLLGKLKLTDKKLKKRTFQTRALSTGAVFLSGFLLFKILR